MYKGQVFKKKTRLKIRVKLGIDLSLYIIYYSVEIILFRTLYSCSTTDELFLAKYFYGFYKRLF